MKNNILAVLVFALALVFLVGCTPTAQETINDEMPTEAAVSDSMESGDQTMSDDTMNSDDMSSDDMKDNDMSDSDMKDDDMKSGDMSSDDMDAMSEYKDITPAEAQELIDTTPDLVIIDVSPNYDAGHLPGALNYYVGDGSLDKAIPMLDKEVPYLVYCHVDSASISGAQKLVDAGFPMVYRLEGNYAAWVDAGYPVEK